MAANDPRVHIGLGKEKQIKDIEVYWPDGSRSTYESFKLGFHSLLQQVQ